MRTLTEIIAKLESNKFPAGTNVGKDYTKADLLADLRALKSARDSEVADLDKFGCGYVECGMRRGG